MTSLKCPKCNKEALYSRMDGSQRCARCGHVVEPAMKQKKPVSAEQTQKEG